MTPALAIFAVFAGLNAVLYLALTGHVIGFRGKRNRAMGDGGDTDMAMAIRGHANAAEQIPLGLILLGTMAAMGTPAWVVGLLGLAFTLGRVLHGMHFALRIGGLATRSIGMLLTLLSTGVMALGVLAHGISGLF